MLKKKAFVTCSDLFLLTASILFVFAQLHGKGRIPDGRGCGREACRHSFPSQRELELDQEHAVSVGRRGRQHV